VTLREDDELGGGEWSPEIEQGFFREEISDTA